MPKTNRAANRAAKKAHAKVGHPSGIHYVSPIAEESSRYFSTVAKQEWVGAVTQTGAITPGAFTAQMLMIPSVDSSTGDLTALFESVRNLTPEVRNPIFSALSALFRRKTYKEEMVQWKGLLKVGKVDQLVIVKLNVITSEDVERQVGDELIKTALHSHPGWSHISTIVGGGKVGDKAYTARVVEVKHLADGTVEILSDDEVTYHVGDRYKMGPNTYHMITEVYLARVITIWEMTQTLVGSLPWGYLDLASKRIFAQPNDPTFLKRMKTLGGMFVPNFRELFEAGRTHLLEMFEPKR